MQMSATVNYTAGKYACFAPKTTSGNEQDCVWIVNAKRQKVYFKTAKIISPQSFNGARVKVYEESICKI